MNTLRYPIKQAIPSNVVEKIYVENLKICTTESIRDAISLAFWCESDLRWVWTLRKVLILSVQRRIFH